MVLDEKRIQVAAATRLPDSAGDCEALENWERKVFRRE